MQEPVIHNASQASIALPPQIKAAEKPKGPTIEGDPLNAFEHFPFQIRTDLSAWMTFSEEERIRKAKAFSNLKGDELNKMNPDRRAKVLCYIIWLEAHHPNGSRLPSAAAFNGLFPQKVTVGAS